jgi:hypothetical protein
VARKHYDGTVYVNRRTAVVRLAVAGMPPSLARQVISRGDDEAWKIVSLRSRRRRFKKPLKTTVLAEGNRLWTDSENGDMIGRQVVLALSADLPMTFTIVVEDSRGDQESASVYVVADDAAARAAHNSSLRTG